LDVKAIGARIRKLRGSALQEELAEFLGVSQGQLSKIEKGRVPPSLEIVVALAGKYETTIDWIVNGGSK
jgi:transcriptional regulator with XRE-family HTH domain